MRPILRSLSFFGPGLLKKRGEGRGVHGGGRFEEAAARSAWLSCVYAAAAGPLIVRVFFIVWKKKLNNN